MWGALKLRGGCKGKRRVLGSEERYCRQGIHFDGSTEMKNLNGGGAGDTWARYMGGYKEGSTKRGVTGVGLGGGSRFYNAVSRCGDKGGGE